jgi:hypothetical protein
MPRTVPESPELADLLARQDGVVSLQQLTGLGVSRTTVDKRVSRRRWQRLLPGVVMTTHGVPNRRQRLVAAWVWGGPGSAIDGADACTWHGMPMPTHDLGAVHIVVPATSPLRSRDFVVVRRSTSEIVVCDRGRVPYVDAPTALIVAARNCPSFRDAVSLLSRGLQQRLVREQDLFEARERIGDKWCRGVDRALVAVGVGLRSPAETDAHDLLSRSATIPAPLWNVWLDLGDGQGLVCVDALWEDAGLVAEINGRAYHAWGEQFEDMHLRTARLTAAGLVVLPCTPRQLRQRAAATLEQFERTYLTHAGRGMPRGVRRTNPPSIAR